MKVKASEMLEITTRGIIVNTRGNIHETSGISTKISGNIEFERHKKSLGVRQAA
jgi:hypothetical protein